MLRLLAFLIALAACASGTPPTTSPAASHTCITGAFVRAFEDDGHGVSVELASARTSATQYQPSTEQTFYVHDAGNPTRGLHAGDEVWLIANDPGAPWPWRYVTRDEARTHCPAVTR